MLSSPAKKPIFGTPYTTGYLDRQDQGLALVYVGKSNHGATTVMYFVTSHERLFIHLRIFVAKYPSGLTDVSILYHFNLPGV